MSTLTITRDRLVLDLETGDLITQIDGRLLPRPIEVLLPRHGAGLNRIDAVALVNPTPDSGVEWNLYPDTQVDDDVTVERADTEPQPEPEAPPVVARRPRKPAQRTGLWRIESGVYEHPDGRYRVERIDSLGDGWSEARQETVQEVTTSAWVVTERPAHPNGEWEEVSLEWPTKRAAVEALEALVRKNAAAPTTARGTGSVTEETPRTKYLIERARYRRVVAWGDEARRVLRRNRNYVEALRDLADRPDGVLTVSGSVADRRSTGTVLGFAARYGWVIQLDTNPGRWQITQAGLDVILAWDAEQEM